MKDAIGDEKAAKSLQTAAKGIVKDPSKKRGAPDSLSSTDSKRKKSAYELSNEPQTPQALEASLALPNPSVDEEEISKTTIHTNRAPLVLAFAVELLKYTMPEQPLSSRLSLAQAVVSLNSKSKAVNLGISNGATAEQDGWGQGQPKIRIMGREVHVLKRGGYDWKADDESEVDTTGAATYAKAQEEASSSSEVSKHPEVQQADIKIDDSQWRVSQIVTLKKSTFVARSIGVKSSAQARSMLQQLLESNKEIREASHNITAWRILSEQGGVFEECNDDGESGGGRHVLNLLQSLNLTNVLVVVTRWYGGIMLGTDRWRIMSEVTRDSLAQRLRISGTIGQEALWGLDLETMRDTNAPVVGGTASGMPVHKAEGARAYIMKAFASSPGTDTPAKKKTGVALEREKEHNLGLLLGALDLLFASWVEHISREDLDRRAWSWYVQVRPDVESGVAGWGGKGDVRLADILNLRRKG